MKPRRYTSEGIVIFRKNYGEADRILIVFSKNFGKIRLLAKSIRKVKSRKRGHLEIFSHIRFSAQSTRGIDLITEVETINLFTTLRVSLRKVAVAYYFAEVLDKLTREEEKQEHVFDLFLDYINQINTAKSLKALRQNFIEKLLISLGYWPLGKKMFNPDKILEEVMERRVNSSRVGKKLLV